LNFTRIGDGDVFRLKSAVELRTNGMLLQADDIDCE
jgi:hypothetical protein